MHDDFTAAAGDGGFFGSTATGTSAAGSTASAAGGGAGDILPDRQRFYEDLAATCVRATAETRPFVLALIDVNGVEDVLAVFGPAAWDATIAAVTERLSVAAPRGSAVYHIRTSRYGMMLPSADFNAAARQAQAIVALLAEPFVIEDLAVTFETRIGLSRFPNHGADAPSLARCALVALKECDIAGETFSVFDPIWDANQRERYRLLRDLRQALGRDDELLLHYQPKVDLRNGTCTGVEALLRWQHSTRGMIPPASFIPATEQTTMIHEVTERVVTMGLERLVRWGLEGHNLTMSVNLSARDLADRNIAERIGNIVKFYGSRPTHLEFEVTETAIMENPRLAADNIARLKALGASVAIDDFGTGHSSLAYLADLPCDTLKIDRAFVASIKDGRRNQSIVRAAIALAHELGMTVVAEGVEDADTVSALQAWDCDAAQGYFFGKPVPEPSFEPKVPGC
ncbi:MAG: putative bifunctional diguanylate cyclase/phosphodiesterase [Alphaproteobacteria bacterium]